MKVDNRGFSFVEILAVIVIIGLLTGISIAAFSRYKENAIKGDYEALARSSYNAMEEYMMSHPYDDTVSLETLEEENLLSNRKDPGSKDTDCTGTVEVSKNSGSNGKLDDGTYKVNLCCVSIQKTYTYPGGKETNLTDSSKCEYVPEDIPTPPPTPGTKYTLKYNDNGGSGCSSKSITRNAGEAWGSLCSPTRSGYTFKGWKYGSESITSSSIANGNKTVVAQWTSNTTPTYTVTLNNNGATSSGTGSVKVKVGDTKLSSITNPKKVVTITYTNNVGATVTGGDKTKSYTLNGWYTANSGGSKVASNSTTPVLQKSVSGYTDSNGKWTKKSNSTLYAQWAPVTATLPTITKTGYTCKWTTDNGTNTVASGGTWKFTSANSRTFTASCTVNSYTCAAGKYLPKTKTSCATCTSGNYCPGGTYKFSTTIDQGLTKCPTGYGNSAAGSSQNTQCYMNVAAGYYIKIAKSSTTTACSPGTFKEAHTVYYSKTSSCNSCPAGYGNSAAGSKVNTQCYMVVPANKYVKKAKDSSPTNCELYHYSSTHNVYYNNVSSCTGRLKPAEPTITYSYNNKWTNKDVVLKIKTTTDSAYIGNWYYYDTTINDIKKLKKLDGTVVTKDNSFSWDFYKNNTSINKTVNVRACSIYATSGTDSNNCSNFDSVKILNDKIKPVINPHYAINRDHGSYTSSCDDYSSTCKLNYGKNYGIYLKATDSGGSGIYLWGAKADYKNGGVCNWNKDYVFSFSTRGVCTTLGSGPVKRCYVVKDKAENVSGRICTCSKNNRVSEISNPDKCW